MKIGVYKGELYRISQSKEGKLYLYSWEEREGFREVPSITDYMGKVHSGRYKREVKEEELEDAYELRYKIICQGEQLGLSQGTDHVAETNKILLGTTKYSIAKKIGGFEQVDKYYYEKEVPIDEIDSFIEIREPMFQFENTKQMTSRKIPKEEIMDYAKYMASFA